MMRAYLILICFLGLSNCKNSDDVSVLSSKEKALVKEIVDYTVNNLKIQGKPYLIDPFFNRFEFNSYTHNYRNEVPKDKNKAVLLDKHKWNNEEFLEIKNKINQKYFNKFNDGLLKFSMGEKSNWIIKISGFYEQFVFVEVINYCEEITKEQLIKGEEIEKNPKWEVTSYVYELSSNKINNKLVDNVVIFEDPCRSTNVTPASASFHNGYR